MYHKLHFYQKLLYDAPSLCSFRSPHASLSHFQKILRHVSPKKEKSKERQRRHKRERREEKRANGTVTRFQSHPYSFQKAMEEEEEELSFRCCITMEREEDIFFSIYYGSTYGKGRESMTLRIFCPLWNAYIF